MEQDQNNILSLLLQLGAHPQRAQAGLRILESSSAGLEKDSKAMGQHTAEILKATKAQQDSIAVFARLLEQSIPLLMPMAYSDGIGAHGYRHLAGNHGLSQSHPFC